MHGVKPITAENSPAAGSAKLHKVKPCAILKDFRDSAKRSLAPKEIRYRKIDQLIPNTNSNYH